MLLRFLAGGIAARLASYSAIGLGFWLLYRAFGAGGGAAGIGWGIGGGILILLGMFLLVSVGRAGGFAPGAASDIEQEEDSPSDSVHGGNQGG